MKEYNEIGKDEMLEWAKMNGMSLSEGQAKELVNDENQDINLDEWFKANDINPIGEYENVSKRMKAKIKEIIESLKEEKAKQQSDDRDEKDNLDEKDGKEQLDTDKKEKVEADEKERQKEEGKEEIEEDKSEKDKDDIEENEEKTEEKKQIETPKKDEYLAKVKKLHEMKIVDYKEQMKKDDAKMDKYFVTMIYLQREINRNRNAFVKEYGEEELNAVENHYLREELKYQKTLDMRMEKDLSRLRELDEKLDSILDRMQELQLGLEKGNIDIELYNDEINSLEKEKLDTLWQINKLNPTLLEEKQEKIEERDEFENRKVPRNIQKERAVSPELKAKQKGLDYMEKKQEGVSEKLHDDMKDNIQRDIDGKEKRLDELRKELKGIDIESPEGKKRALEVIGEIQTLESQKASQEKQQKNLERNMDSSIQSYGDLKESEQERQDDTEEFEEIIEDINPNEVSNDLMAELKNAAMKDPETPEQAEEYLDNIKETTEDAMESKEKEEQEEDNVPSLFNRRKRPF